MTLVPLVTYAVVSRTIKFPLGAGSVVPSYLVLVPMLLLLPPLTVPLFAAAALVAGTGGAAGRRRGKPQELLFSIPDAWHALGPAVVLSLAPAVTGRPRRRSTSPPCSPAASSTSLVSTARESLITGGSPRRSRDA